MRQRPWQVGIWITALLLTSAQAPLPQPQPTLRIGVTAVEIDAVVTDSQGRHVPDLQIGDFALRQDGKPQATTSFRYVPVRPAPAPHPGTPAGPASASAQLRRGQAGRVMAIVIDDLSVGFADMARVRDALQQFVTDDL